MVTPDDEYSHRNMQIFWQQLQMPLPQKGKTFCGYCISEMCMKFRTFWKKEYSSLIITEIISSERDIYLSV